MSREEGATCWICLEEGPDDAGQPLRRDCACRGSHAGFAHLSCTTNYAEQKSKQVTDSGQFDPDDFVDPWKRCHNCKQNFQNNLALELSTAFVSFAEKTHDFEGNDFIDQLLVLDSLRTKIEVITHQITREGDQILCEEGKTCVDILHSKIHQIMKERDMAGWVHEPKTSEEFWMYTSVRAKEATAYVQLGILSQRMDQTEEGCCKKAVDCFLKAKAIYKLLGMDKEARVMDNNIVNVKSICGVSVNEDPMAIVKRHRQAYENKIQTHGRDSEHAIQMGLMLGETLANNKVHHRIEAERLVSKLAATCQRVYGREHILTKNAQKLLTRLKQRMVIVEGKTFEALRYEDDGNTLVIKGPITKPRDDELEEVITVASDQEMKRRDSVWPRLGCIVTCHGLNNASHLNGKICDIRSLKMVGEVSRYEVHFEDKNLKPALVKPENLRVVIDLPEVEE